MKNDEKIGEKAKGGFLRRKLNQVNEMISFSYFFNLIRAMQLKIILGAITPLNGSNLSSSNASSSSAAPIIAITILIGYLGLLIILGVVITQRSAARRKGAVKELNEHQRIIDWIKMEKEFKKGPETRGKEEIYLLASFTANFVIPIILVISTENSFIQTICLLAMKGLLLYLLVRYKPYKEGSRNIIEIGNNAFYLLLLMIFLISKMIEKKISERQKFFVIGNIIIFLISGLMVFNVTMIILTKIKEFRKKTNETKTRFTLQASRRKITTRTQAASAT